MIDYISVKVGPSAPPSNSLTPTVTTSGFVTSTNDTSSTTLYIEVRNNHATNSICLLSVTVYRQGGLDPTDPDCDEDDLLDGEEISPDNGYITFPLVDDTDGDFLRDGFEIDSGLDPNPEYTSRINTVLLNPYQSGADNAALAEEAATHFFEENFVMLLMFVNSIPDGCPTYPDGSPMLEIGLNEFIIPFGVFYHCKFYTDSGGGYEHLQSQFFKDYARNVTYYNRSSYYSTKKIAHISFAMDPGNAFEFINTYLLKDNAGTIIAQGTDIRYDLGRMFNKDDSPELLRAITTVTPTAENLAGVDFNYLMMFDLMYQILEANSFEELDNGIGTSLMEDNDGDGLSVWCEVAYNLLDSDSDADEDGLKDGDEVCVYYTNPIIKDTDGDGLWDGDEIDPEHITLDPTSNDPYYFDSDPTLYDSDGDGINDSNEVTIYTPENPNELEYDEWQTDPMDPDTDGDTIMDNEEKFERKVELPNNHRLVDHGTKTVTLTGVNGDADLLISVFVNVGINHPHPEDLAETIKVTYDSINIFIENPYNPESGNEKAGNPDNDTSLYVTEEVDFSGWGTNPPSTWNVEIEDTDDDGDVGILEQFEVVLNSYTDPTEADSDNDGLNDSEEANLGKDGYITDPNVWDMDDDGWNDGAEFTHKTDPMNPDTDRDGVNDPYDIDPLHDLFLQVKVTRLSSCGKYSDHNMKVNVSVNNTYIAGSKSLDFLSQEYERNKDIEFYVSIDIDDSAPSGAQIDMILKSYKAYRAGDETGDLLLDTGIDEDLDADISHKILDSGEFGATKGITKGNTADYGQVWYEINTLSLDKVTTHFILPNDGSKTYTAENESLRYVGEQRYYAVVMNVDNDRQEMVIIPESVFYDSELGDILLDEDMSDDNKKDKFEDWGLDGLQFSSADEDKVELSRYLKGVWVVDITASQIDDVILHLTVNKTCDTPYEDIEVQDQIWTLGLPGELLELTPTISPKLSPLSRLTIVVKEDPIDEWVEKIDNSFSWAPWGWVKEPVTKLVKVTRETFNFVVTLGEAILSGNPGAAMQALEDYGNFVWQGIVSFAQSAAEFYVKMNAIFVTLALATLKALKEKLAEIGEAIVEGLNILINVVLGLVKQGFKSVFMGLINENQNWKNAVGQRMDQAVIDYRTSGKVNVQNVFNEIFGYRFLFLICCLFAYMIAMKILLKTYSMIGMIMMLVFPLILLLLVTLFSGSISADVPTDGIPTNRKEVENTVQLQAFIGAQYDEDLMLALILGSLELAFGAGLAYAGGKLEVFGLDELIFVIGLGMIFVGMLIASGVVGEPETSIILRGIAIGLEVIGMILLVASLLSAKDDIENMALVWLCGLMMGGVVAYNIKLAIFGR